MTTTYDRNGRSMTDRTEQSRQISDNLRGSESSRDVYTANSNTSLAANSSIGKPAGAGGAGAGKRAGGLGSILGVGGSIQYAKNASDGVQFDHETNESRSDQTTYGSSSSGDRTHGNGRDVQSSDGSYSREGTFRRNEGFSGTTNTSESYDDYSQRINREAAALDERGARLDRAASYAENNGYTLNQDMSQYLTSRYLELQHGDMRSLDLPDLYRTDLTGDQRERRDMAIQAAMKEFTGSSRTGVSSRLREPEIARVVAPKPATIQSLTGTVPSGGLGSGDQRESDNGRAARQAEISTAGSVIESALDQQNSTHGQAILGAGSVRDEHNRRTNREWFSSRK